MQKESRSEGPWKGCEGRDWSSRTGLGRGVSTEVGGSWHLFSLSPATHSDSPGSRGS